jgi:hypothetical protein
MILERLRCHETRIHGWHTWLIIEVDSTLDRKHAGLVNN